uniref:Uncharacterized protein n=1 Tax=Kalanchoe fedtschenkoi TaxID=63787 RepID=A0A7N0UNA1_KALFE
MITNGGGTEEWQRNHLQFFTVFQQSLNPKLCQSSKPQFSNHTMLSVTRHSSSIYSINNQFHVLHTIQFLTQPVYSVGGR